MPRPRGRIKRTNTFQVPRQLRRHRYRLGFEVNPAGVGRLLVVGLNPSTASLTHRDPTVDSFCKGLAVANGYRELEIVNLFALRSTDKTALVRDRNPIGRAADSHIAAACREADAVLLAWGLHFHPLIAFRAAKVEQLVRRHARPPPDNRPQCRPFSGPPALSQHPVAARPDCGRSISASAAGIRFASSAAHGHAIIRFPAIPNRLKECGMSSIGPIIAASGHLSVMSAERLIAGIKPESFARLARPGGVAIQSNHPAWIFGHLTLYPVRVLAALDRPVGPGAYPPQYEALFNNGVECRDDVDGTIYPSMAELTGHFFEAYKAAVAAIRSAADETFVKPNPAEGRMRELFPSIGAALNFYVGGHVQNHLGQLSAWRRAMGMPAA